MFNILSFINKYKIEYGKEPTIEEILERFDIDEKTLRGLLNLSQSSISLSTFLFNDKDASNYIEDESLSLDNVLDEVYYEELRKILFNSMQTDREKQLLNKILEEENAVIKIEGLSKQRVHQIKLRIKYKLATSIKLRRFLSDNIKCFKRINSNYIFLHIPLEYDSPIYIPDSDKEPGYRLLMKSNRE